MDQNKPVLSYEDFIAYIDCQKAIIVLKDAIGKLEYTGLFNASDQHRTIELVTKLRNIIDKKLIDK